MKSAILHKDNSEILPEAKKEIEIAESFLPQEKYPVLPEETAVRVIEKDDGNNAEKPKQPAEDFGQTLSKDHKEPQNIVDADIVIGKDEKITDDLFKK